MSIELNGAHYRITLMPSGEGMDWPDVPGLYAFVDLSAGAPRIVFIDETVSVRQAIQSKPYWLAAVELGATHVYAAMQAQDRGEILGDLIATYRPALLRETPLVHDTDVNDVLDALTERPARAPSPTGVHDILDAMFEKTNPTDQQGFAQFEKPGVVMSRFGAQDRNPEAATSRSSSGTPPRRRGLLDILSAVHIRRS